MGEGWSVGYSMAEETLVVLDFSAVILQCCGEAFVPRTISRSLSMFEMLFQDCVFQESSHDCSTQRQYEGQGMYVWCR